MSISTDDEVLDVDPLTAQDRCDRCGAQAYTRVIIPGPSESALLFCAHHTHEHQDALRDKGAMIARDERPKLDA